MKFKVRFAGRDILEADVDVSNPATETVVVDFDHDSFMTPFTLLGFTPAELRAISQGLHRQNAREMFAQYARTTVERDHWKAQVASMPRGPQVILPGIGYAPTIDERDNCRGRMATLGQDIKYLGEAIVEFSEENLRLTKERDALKESVRQYREIIVPVLHHKRRKISEMRRQALADARAWKQRAEENGEGWRVASGLMNDWIREWSALKKSVEPILEAAKHPSLVSTETSAGMLRFLAGRLGLGGPSGQVATNVLKAVADLVEAEDRRVSPEPELTDEGKGAE